MINFGGTGFTDQPITYFVWTIPAAVVLVVRNAQAIGRASRSGDRRARAVHRHGRAGDRRADPLAVPLHAVRGDARRARRDGGHRRGEPARRDTVVHDDRATGASPSPASPSCSSPSPCARGGRPRRHGLPARRRHANRRVARPPRSLDRARRRDPRRDHARRRRRGARQRAGDRAVRLGRVVAAQRGRGGHPHARRRTLAGAAVGLGRRAERSGGVDVVPPAAVRRVPPDLRRGSGDRRHRPRGDAAQGARGVDVRRAVRLGVPRCAAAGLHAASRRPGSRPST